MSDARLLVEGKSAGLEVDGIVQLLRRSLIRQHPALPVALQIDVDLAGGGHVARGRVVSELSAVDLVETIGVVAVDDDVYFVQNGAASVLVLFGALGMDAEESPAAFGLRKREPFRALLNVYVEFFGSMLNGMMDAPAR